MTKKRNIIYLYHLNHIFVEPRIKFYFCSTFDHKEIDRIIFTIQYKFSLMTENEIIIPCDMYHLLNSFFHVKPIDSLKSPFSTEIELHQNWQNNINIDELILDEKVLNHKMLKLTLKNLMIG